MNLSRFLAEDRVDLDASSSLAEEDKEPTYEHVVQHMAELLCRSEDVINGKKITQDLILRERRTPTFLGQGIAMPHVRTLQARRLIMAVAVFPEELLLQGEFEDPLRLVIAFVGPPYDDRQYLTAYRHLGAKLEKDGFVESFFGVDQPGEVLRHLGS